MGTERKIVPNAVFFRGKRHDNKILKVQILLSRNFVVIAQAPRIFGDQFCFFQKFRKGVGGRGLATSRVQYAAKKGPRNWVPLLIRGDRKKGAEKRLECLA